ncbi:TetR/AcrR family transcriptional regulator [Paenibacillus puerhi]|uniref:TetR/AcrR family transcriptional regulator n=1 Tax=Paenibacillus puerhi TaxID=2692622 RepID=UPI001359ECB9
MLREIRKRELQEQIFTQAMQLFEIKGFDQVTVEEITKACGIAKGTFYNYFAKKEEILLHLGSSQLETVRVIAARCGEIPHLRDRLLLLFRELFARYTERPQLIRLTITELMRSRLHVEQELQIVHRFQELVAALLEQAKRDRLLMEHADSADLAAILVSIYFNSLLTWASSDKRGVELEAVFMRQFDVIWQGIRSWEAREA